MTYYVTKSGDDGFYELRQERFKKQYEEGIEHPHDVCAVAPSLDTLRDMVDQAKLGNVDWTAVEEHRPAP